MYVESTYKYLHNFRTSMESATIKITIENHQSLKLLQTAKVELLKKYKATCQVGVEFNTDEMDRFQVHNHVCTLSV